MESSIDWIQKYLSNLLTFTTNWVILAKSLNLSEP